MKEKYVLPKAVEQLVLDIAKYLDERQRWALEDKHSNTTRVKKDPVAWLVSLLKQTKKNLPEVSAMLYSTVELTSFDGYLQEARKLIEESEEVPVASR
jgi:hypothetical protein